MAEFNPSLLAQPFAVGQIQFSRPPQTDEEFMIFAGKVADELARVTLTEQDVWWFVMEQYDRLYEASHICRRWLMRFPLLPIEYEGRRSETSYVGEQNSGVQLFQEYIFPELEKVFGTNQAYQMTSGVFIVYIDRYLSQINALRTKFAMHFHNNCVEAGHYRMADRWNEVPEAVSRMGSTLI